MCSLSPRATGIANLELLMFVGLFEAYPESVLFCLGVRRSPEETLLFPLPSSFLPFSCPVLYRSRLHLWDIYGGIYILHVLIVSNSV